MNELVGRTIVGVSESRWGDELELRLDDGSLAVVKGYGYEDVDLDVSILDRAAQNERARERVGRQHRDWLSRLTAARRHLDEERIRAKARAQLSPEAYEEWLRDRLMTLDKAGWILGQVFAKPILDALNEKSILFTERTFDEHAVLPVVTKDIEP